MSFNNRPYKTRQSGRYNIPGQFISAGELACAAAQREVNDRQRAHPAADSGINQESEQQNHNHQYNQVSRQQQQQNLQSIQTEDVQMKSEIDEQETAGTETRPSWMKAKLAGVKKISKKERRRRQNGQLRRLLTPKNAVMVLNEMLPDEGVTNQFKVEAAPTSLYYQQVPGRSFCAELTLYGTSYKGYGENKILARNAAAEQAIRDLIIKKMGKAIAAEGAGSESAGGAGGAGGESGEGGAEEEPEALPMIQLASYALHKLFAEWEHDGHRVPQLRPAAALAQAQAEAEVEMEATAGVGVGVGVAVGARARSKARAGVRKPKELPANAARMHPCMLLTYLRPALAYRELAAEGDRPQAMTYTLGIDVDGTTYIGKAPNKKEARRAAAQAACTALYGVEFEAGASENAPQVPV